MYIYILLLVLLLVTPRQGQGQGQGRGNILHHYYPYTPLPLHHYPIPPILYYTILYYTITTFILHYPYTIYHTPYPLHPYTPLPYIPYIPYRREGPRAHSRHDEVGHPTLPLYYTILYYTILHHYYPYSPLPLHHYTIYHTPYPLHPYTPLPYIPYRREGPRAHSRHDEVGHEEQHERPAGEGVLPLPLVLLRAAQYRAYRV
jgi:hypothetical protein